MDISAFSSYLLLCEEMNYAAAARRCFMTRQALRQTVQALEKHYRDRLQEEIEPCRFLPNRIMRSTNSL